MSKNNIVDSWNDLVSYISYLGELNSSTSVTLITREEVELKIQQAISSSSGSIDAQAILNTVYGKGYLNSSEVEAIVNKKISAVVDSAPEDLDTLKEIAQRIQENKTLIPTKISQLVNDSNFINEHQSLAEYAKISLVNSELFVIDSSIESIKTELNETTKIVDFNHMISQLTTRIALLESANTTMKYADSSTIVTSISAEEAKTTDLVVTSSEAISSMTDATKTYKSIVVVGGEADKTLQINATDSVVIDGLQINGQKDAGNGKVNYTTPELTIKNAVINVENSNYNVFEGSLKPSETSTLNTNITVENMSVDGKNLAHNVINVYTPATGAKIVIKDSSFDLNVKCTNVLRISNTPNSDNVEILFDNVDWTYENNSSSATDSDWTWAGLIIYQPYGTDVAYTSNDLSHIATWKFTFKNCRYNSIKVSENNFSKHNTVAYSYNINKTGAVSDMTLTGATFVFE